MKLWWIFRGVVYIKIYQIFMNVEEDDRFSWKQAWDHFDCLAEFDYDVRKDERQSPSKSFWEDMSYS